MYNALALMCNYIFYFKSLTCNRKPKSFNGYVHLYMNIESISSNQYHLKYSVITILGLYILEQAKFLSII